MVTNYINAKRYGAPGLSSPLRILVLCVAMAGFGVLALIAFGDSNTDSAAGVHALEGKDSASARHLEIEDGLSLYRKVLERFAVCDRYSADGVVIEAIQRGDHTEESEIGRFKVRFVRKLRFYFEYIATQDPNPYRTHPQMYSIEWNGLLASVLLQFSNGSRKSYETTIEESIIGLKGVSSSSSFEIPRLLLGMATTPNRVDYCNPRKDNLLDAILTTSEGYVENEVKREFRVDTRSFGIKEVSWSFDICNNISCTILRISEN